MICAFDVEFSTKILIHIAAPFTPVLFMNVQFLTSEQGQVSNINVPELRWDVLLVKIEFKTSP